MDIKKSSRNILPFKDHPEKENPVHKVFPPLWIIIAALLLTAVILVFIWFQLSPAYHSLFTRTAPIDHMVQVYVPAGNFVMGTTDKQWESIINQCQLNGIRTEDCEDWYKIEKPAHTVWLDAYWIDQTDITNAMYALCVRAGQCRRPNNDQSASHLDYYLNDQFADYPVLYINWYQAFDYCAWAGRKLPTEAQWEKAARGAEARTYPWGEDISCLKTNFLGASGPCLGDTSPAGSYPQNASSYGALDMAGNVWQWVYDWYDEGYYASPEAKTNPGGPFSGGVKIIRGGSWNNNEMNIRSANRLRVVPTFER